MAEAKKKIISYKPVAPTKTISTEQSEFKTEKLSEKDAADLIPEEKSKLDKVFCLCKWYYFS